MDCAECTQHVQHAISRWNGVASVDVLLGAEKAIIRLDAAKVDLPANHRLSQRPGAHVGGAWLSAAVAAAAQSLPDVSILASSARLRRQGNRKGEPAS
jgi:cation transport ATPase